MSSIPVSIPIEIYEKAKAIAEAENVPVGEVFASAFIDQLTARARLAERAARGSREKFLAVLDKAPDVEAAAYDRPN
jgi:hypothetical protein